MKFYSIRIDYKESPSYTEKYPQGKCFKNLNEYFEKNKNIISVEGYDKDQNVIYREYPDKRYDYGLRDTNGKQIYIKWRNGRIEYPKGKERYDQYMLKFKKEKLEKILSKKEEKY